MKFVKLYFLCEVNGNLRTMYIVSREKIMQLYCLMYAVLGESFAIVRQCQKVVTCKYRV